MWNTTADTIAVVKPFIHINALTKRITDDLLNKHFENMPAHILHLPDMTVMSRQAMMDQVMSSIRPELKVRLLNDQNIKVSKDDICKIIASKCKYAILSHRWGAEEPTFQKMEQYSGIVRSKSLAGVVTNSGGVIDQGIHHLFLTSYSHVHSHPSKSSTPFQMPHKPQNKLNFLSPAPSPGHPMADRNTEGQSSRSARRIPKPADLRDSLRGSASPLPTSGLAADLRTAAGSTSGPARAAAAAQAAAAVLFRSPTPSPSSPAPPMTQDDGDNTVTGRTPVFVPPPPSPTSRSVLLADVNREFFMDEDAEEPQHFYAVGARDRVSDDLGGRCLIHPQFG
jgi:hypothetical protein